MGICYGETREKVEAQETRKLAWFHPDSLYGDDGLLCMLEQYGYGPGLICILSKAWTQCPCRN